MTQVSDRLDRMHRLRHRLGLQQLLLAAGTTIALAGGAFASDYSNECKSSDGRYVIEDGALFRSSDADRKQRLAYGVLEEQVLELREGYCIPSNREANGARYANQFRKSRQRIVFDEAGVTREASVVCELASSGLPAAFDCARETTTRNQTQPGPMQPYRLGTPGTWQHNGSVMKLEANGNERRFVYMNPREGLRDAGVSADMTLFEGRRDRGGYVGTARYFSARCGEQTFEVSGPISRNESRVTLIGDAPRLDDRCQRIGTREERLVFDRMQ